MSTDIPALPKEPVLEHPNSVASDTGHDLDEKSNVEAKRDRDMTDLEAPSTSVEDEKAKNRRYKPYILTGLALLILGWWISATVLEDTRHRWYVHPDALNHH